MNFPAAQAAPGAGPYRGGQAIERFRPAGITCPRSLAESRLIDAVCLDLGGRLTAPKTTRLHVIMSIVVFGPLLGVLVGLPFGVDPVLLLPALAFGGLFGWLWRLAMRTHRASELLNGDRLDDAERRLGSARFGTELIRGLCLTQRGDHARAADEYRRSLAMLERRPIHMQPIHAQAYPREAIALVNLGRLAEAQTRLQTMPAGGGEYLDALRLTAWSYMALAAGQPLAPDAVRALESTFAPVRGSWGGLALAAYGHARLGDQQACLRLIDAEKDRAGWDRVAVVMPHLAAFVEQCRAARR